MEFRNSTSWSFHRKVRVGITGDISVTRFPLCLLQYLNKSAH